MNDDAISRAKERCECGFAPPTYTHAEGCPRLLTDPRGVLIQVAANISNLIALAESQATQIAAIRELHYRRWWEPGKRFECGHCTTEWPCFHIAILDRTTP